MREGFTMDVVRALEAAGGAARRGALLKAGCTDHAVRVAVAQGRVRVVGRGLLAVPGAPADAVLAARLGAQLTCLSALARAELPLPVPPSCAHLAVRDSFTRHGKDTGGARLHYSARPLGQGPTVSIADALDAAGACLDETWHLVAVDAALNRGLITLGEVLRFRKSSAQRRDFLLNFADARSEAPGETIARLRLVKAGYRVRPQAHVEGAGRVDLEVEGVLIVQVDGYVPHSGKPAFRRDREKSRAVIKAGRPQLSYAASDLLGYWSTDVVGEVRDALGAWKATGGRTRGPFVP